MLRRISLLLLCCVAAAASGGAVRAQSLGGLLPQSSPGALPQGVRQDGLYMVAPIAVDGVPVLRVAVPLSDANAAVDVDARAQAIETAIQQLFAVEGTGAAAHTLYDPKTFRVEVRAERDEALLVASDARRSSDILTVTSVDAKYQRKTVAALAAQWQQALQTQLLAALQKRQPEEVRQNSTALAIVAAALAALTILISICLALLRGRMRALRSGLVLFLLLAWFVAITWALLLFAQTTSLGYQLLRHVLRIAFVWIVALLLLRAAEAVIARVATVYARAAAGAEDRTRRLLRVPTIVRTSTGFAAFVVVFVAVLSSIGQLGLSLGSVLTIGGVLALGVSLAAQNLVRDVLNGFLVIVEDQFVVGDFVTINGTSGVVEHMTLRIVQVRDSGGNLITIPHSTATGVTNSSRNWSRIDYTIPVAPETDPAAALDVLTKTIEGLAAERDWNASFVEPVEWCGVDSMWRDGVVLRVSIKTAPLQQFRLRREINARVLSAFAKEKIALGINPGGQAVALLPPLT